MAERVRSMRAVRGGERVCWCENPRTGERVLKFENPCRFERADKEQTGRTQSVRSLTRIFVLPRACAGVGGAYAI